MTRNIKKPDPIDPLKMRTLRNWIGDGVISHAQAKEIIDTGKVARLRAHKTLVKYCDLQIWGIVK